MNLTTGVAAAAILCTVLAVVMTVIHYRTVPNPKNSVSITSQLGVVYGALGAVLFFAWLGLATL